LARRPSSGKASDAATTGAMTDAMIARTGARTDACGAERDGRTYTSE